MTGLLLPILLACSDPVVPDEQPDVRVRSWLDGSMGANGGTLVVQTIYDPEGELDLPEPEVEGLTFEEAAEPVVEQIGDSEVLTQRFRFQGGKGMYEIGPVTATWHPPEGDDQVVGTSPIFVDLGVEAPREGEPADILEPAVTWRFPWGFAVAGAAGVAVLGGGLFVAFGLTRRRELPEAPPEPPDILALRAWDAVRSDQAMSDHDKAQHLSRIFREYAEAVLSFPAGSWTTTEILNHLRGLAHMPEGNVPRAKRLLRATDRVKFAEHDPERDFFEDLDSDLRAFVQSTRPQSWGGEG